MELLPQAWIVLSIFVICIISNLLFTFFNEKYRRAVFKDSRNEKITYFVQILVMGIVMTYSVQCSVYGSSSMPSCNTFSWLLTVLIIIMFFYGLGSKVYKFIIKGDKTKRVRTEEEIEDEEERLLLTSKK